MATFQLELPPDVTGDPQRLIETLNDRLRTIEQGLNGATNFVPTGNLDMKKYRIVNLGDPVNPQDALTLAAGTARFNATPNNKQVAAPTIVPVSVAGEDTSIAIDDVPVTY